jgi:hypothetical protein
MVSEERAELSIRNYARPPIQGDQSGTDEATTHQMGQKFSSTEITRISEIHMSLSLAASTVSGRHPCHTCR